MPCRKPHRQEWVRVRAGDDWCAPAMVVFEDKANRESFLVDRDIAAELGGEIIPVALFVAVNSQGSPFVWQIKLPGPDGKGNDWNRSAAQAVEIAKGKWTRMYADMSAGHYVIQTCERAGEPVWPDLSFNQLLEICFRDRIIQSWNHVVLKQLRGEI